MTEAKQKRMGVSKSLPELPQGGFDETPFQRDESDLERGVAALRGMALPLVVSAARREERVDGTSLHNKGTRGIQ